MLGPSEVHAKYPHQPPWNPTPATAAQSKNLYEPRSLAHFEALEQTCRLHQLSRSGDKYFFKLAESIKDTVLVL